MVEVSEHAIGKVAAVEGRPAVEHKGAAANKSSIFFLYYYFCSHPALSWAYSYSDSFATKISHILVSTHPLSFSNSTA